MKAIRVAAGILAAFILMLFSGSAILSAGQAAPAAADRDLARIRAYLLDAEHRISRSEYAAAVESLALAWELVEAKTNAAPAPSEYVREQVRAFSRLDELQEKLLADMEADTVRIEKAVGDMTRIEAGPLRKVERLLRDLAEAGGEPADCVYPVIRSLKDAVDIASGQPLFLLTPEEKEDRLRGEARTRSLADRACGATELAAAEGHVSEAAKEVELLERTAAAAGPWREFRKKRADEGGLADSDLRDVRRELDKLQDALPRLEETAGWVAGLKPSVDGELVALRRLADDIGVWQARVVELSRVLGLAMRIDEPEDLRRKAEARLARIKAVDERRGKVEATRARVVEGLDRPVVRDAARWFADADAYVRNLRAGLDELESRVEAADRFAGPSERACEAAQRELDRAKRCLRNVELRAAMAAAAPAAPARSPQPTAGATAGGGVAPPPAPPPPAKAAPQAAAAPQAKPAAAPAAPPVAQDVFGGIKIQGGAAKIGVGQSVRFVATDMGNRVYGNVVWNSHDEECLSLGQDGTATGLKPGKLLIQAKTAEDPYAIAYFEVEVVPAGTGTAAPPATTAQSGAGQTAAGQAGGGFADRGLVVGPEKNVSLLGEEAGSIKPPDKAKPLGPDGGFGNRGLETGQKGEKTDPAAGAAGATAPGRKPDPSSGTGGRQSGGASDPALRPLAFQGGPQPAAWHIFAAGSRLGWAAAHSRFSDGSADQDIVDHLVMAGEHAMWANRESYGPHRAWPNWSEIKVRFRTWAEEIVRDRAPGGRREPLSRSIASYASSMAEQVTFQVLGDRVQMPNCDGAYMRLGFHMGFGHTALQLAEGAVRMGRPETGERARRDAVEHLRQAARVLGEYERTAVVTGTCADLRDVRSELEALLTRADAAAQAVAAGHAWTTASDRIRALSGQPAPIQPDPKPRPAAPPAPARPAPQTAQPPTAASDVWADPGELEGVWVTHLARYRCVKSGSEYTIVLDKIFAPPTPERQLGLFYYLSQQGYREGEVVVRAARTGPHTYRGTYRQRTRVVQNAQGTGTLTADDFQAQVTLTVLGDHLRIDGRQYTVAGMDYQEVLERLLRLGGVIRVPELEGLSHEVRHEVFMIESAMIWFLASRTGSRGETQHALFHDHLDPVAREFTGKNWGPNRQLDIKLNSSDPRYQALRDYIGANTGLRKKLEEAGFKIAARPTNNPTAFGMVK